MKQLIKKIARDSMNEGVMTAVLMIRLASLMKKEWTFDELADAIEATVEKAPDAI